MNTIKIYFGSQSSCLRNMDIKKMFIFPSAVIFLLATTFFMGVAQARDLPEFTALVEKYGSAVVNISTTQKIKHPKTKMMPRGMPEQIPEGPFGDLFRHFFDNPGGPGSGNGEPEHYNA
ncbi:MAG: hypothetical protein KAI17_18355, partial [Thiotrichaceae bacterium]|nr:hypothetical protein [Thiotrichaceae bacterium]